MENNNYLKISKDGDFIRFELLEITCIHESVKRMQVSTNKLYKKSICLIMITKDEFIRSISNKENTSFDSYSYIKTTKTEDKIKFNFVNLQYQRIDYWTTIVKDFILDSKVLKSFYNSNKSKIYFNITPKEKTSKLIFSSTAQKRILDIRKCKEKFNAFFKRLKWLSNDNIQTVYISNDYIKDSFYFVKRYKDEYVSNGGIILTEKERAYKRDKKYCYSIHT